MSSEDNQPYPLNVESTGNHPNDDEEVESGSDEESDDGPPLALSAATLLALKEFALDKGVDIGPATDGSDGILANTVSTYTSGGIGGGNKIDAGALLQSVRNHFDVKDRDETFSYSFSAKDGNCNVSFELKGVKKELGQTLQSTGLTIWRAAEHLCEYLINNRARVQGKRVCELGAGLGLVSVLLDKMNICSSVVSTDGDSDTVELLLQNRDAANCSFEVAQLLWGLEIDRTQAPAESVQSMKHHAVDVGADVVNKDALRMKKKGEKGRVEVAAAATVVAGSKRSASTTFAAAVCEGRKGDRSKHGLNIFKTRFCIRPLLPPRPPRAVSSPFYPSHSTPDLTEKSVAGTIETAGSAAAAGVAGATVFTSAMILHEIVPLVVDGMAEQHKKQQQQQLQEQSPLRLQEHATLSDNENESAKRKEDKLVEEQKENPLQLFDVIVAADVIYEEEQVLPLIQTVTALMKRPGCGSTSGTNVEKIGGARAAGGEFILAFARRNVPIDRVFVVAEEYGLTYLELESQNEDGLPEPIYSFTWQEG